MEAHIYCKCNQPGQSAVTSDTIKKSWSNLIKRNLVSVGLFSFNFEEKRREAAMSKRNRLIFPLMVSVVLLLFSILACYFPWEYPVHSTDLLDTSEARIGITMTAESAISTMTAERKAFSSTIRPTDIAWFLFIDSDCPADLFQGLTTGWGAGSLDCRYHWVGYFGANNVEMRIMQYPDHSHYQQVISSDLANYRTNVANDKAAQAAPGVQNKKNLDIIQDDANGYIYMETYQSLTSVTDPETTLCGNGWGALGVDEKFEVTLSLTESCDISKDADVYSLALENLRDAALKAIQRAEANRAP